MTCFLQYRIFLKILFIFSEFEKIQTRKTSLCAHNVQLANCTEKFNVNLLLDPELIFDRTKLCEDGLHDIFNLFPKDFSLKQIKPELSGNNEILTPADYYMFKENNENTRVILLSMFSFNNTPKLRQVTSLWCLYR